MIYAFYFALVIKKHADKMLIVKCGILFFLPHFNCYFCRIFQLNGKKTSNRIIC